MNYLNKLGQPSKTAIERVINYNNYSGSSWSKLSSFYNSRSTNYHSIYNSDLFIINRDPKKILAAGFQRLTKAIIRLNFENKYVKQILAEYAVIKAGRAKIILEKQQANQILKEDIIIEANSIILDEKFKSDLKSACKLQGAEKSRYCAIAMKSLLECNNIEILSTDFWQVFRILKSKVC